VVGTWSICLRQRSTKKQSVIRVTRRIRKIEFSNSNAHWAVFNFNRHLHTLGVSFIAI
jgi:protein-tyrosine phosphatase